MPTPTSSSSGNDSPSIDFLETLIREIEAQAPFDQDHWKSLKIQLAATRAADLAEIAAKLRVVDHEIQIETDQLDLNILRSAIADLLNVSKTTNPL